jgi:hypothetical protein
LRWLAKSPGIAGNYADAVDADVIGVRHFFAGWQVPYARQPYRDNDRKAPLHPAVERMSDVHVAQALARRGLGYGARRTTDLLISFLGFPTNPVKTLTAHRVSPLVLARSAGSTWWPKPLARPKPTPPGRRSRFSRVDTDIRPLTPPAIIPSRRRSQEARLATDSAVGTTS